MSMKTESSVSAFQKELDFLIRGRIYHPVVLLFYNCCEQEGILDAEMEFITSLSEKARNALLLTLETHVHKEKPLFCYLFAQEYKLDQEKSQCLAVALDVLWMLSLIFDDLQDEDSTRAGKPTVWATFGKDTTLEIGPELLQATLGYVERTCGSDVAKVIQESVAKGVLANLQHSDITIQDSILDDLYQSYDNRNDFNGVLGVEALQLMIGQERFPQEQKVALQHGIRLLNRGSQILNDLKDIDDSYHRGYSDIKNGVTTVPLLVLYSQLTASERTYFMTFYGAKRNLYDAEIEFIARTVQKTDLLSTLVQLVQTHYEQAIQLMSPALGNNSELLTQWVSYKSEPLGKYENR